MNDERKAPRIADLDVDKGITCPSCGQSEFFKEHQNVAQTQHLNRLPDGSYEYDDVEFDEVVEAEEIVCGKCGETIAVNYDTVADQRNRAEDKIRAVVDCLKAVVMETDPRGEPARSVYLGRLQVVDEVAALLKCQEELS